MDEKNKLYVNTSASGMVKFLRVICWILAIIGIIAGIAFIADLEEETGLPILGVGIALFIIAIFMKPLVVRTLAAEISIAKAKEEYSLYSNEKLTEEIKI